MRDDTRAARAADQADPDRNRQFSRPWETAPPVPRANAVTGPDPDEPTKPAHPLAWHAKPRALVMKEAADKLARASWWTR